MNLSFPFLKSPFRAARVFISHSGEDNVDDSDYIARRLADHYTVLYDGNRRLGTGPDIIPAGRSVIPYDFIRSANVFLFLASKNSMEKSGSGAFKELTYAKDLLPTKRPKVIYISLNSYPIPLPPEEGRDRYLPFSTIDRERDVGAIITDLKTVLEKAGGIYYFVYQEDEFPQLPAGGRDPHAMIDCLLSTPTRGLYMFNTIIRYPELQRLVEALQDLPEGQRIHVCERLLEIFFDRDDRESFEIVRENAVILISRLYPLDGALLKYLRQKKPGPETEHLYRGYLIAMGKLGDMRVIREYTRSLFSEPESRHWSHQREVNKHFHVLYYEGPDQAVTRLMESIENLDPLNPLYLLPLNVLTLGDLSSRPYHAESLRDRRQDLITSCDMPEMEKIVDEAIDKILRRAGLI